MMITYQHNDLTIELFEDSAFVQSPDSPTSYDKVIQIEQDKPYVPASQHAIKVYRESNLLVSAIILAVGGATCVHDHTAFIDQNNLIVRCCNKLFSLSLPDLDTNWVTEVDDATCFSIHKYQDTYISHGELSVVRIDRAGKLLWSYGGSDIFVCLNEGNPFEMHNDYILLRDFSGMRYQIDYNGNSINNKSKSYKN